MKQNHRAANLAIYIAALFNFRNNIVRSSGFSFMGDFPPLYGVDLLGSNHSLPIVMDSSCGSRYTFADSVKLFDAQDN